MHTKHLKETILISMAVLIGSISGVTAAIPYSTVSKVESVYIPTTEAAEEVEDDIVITEVTEEKVEDTTEVTTEDIEVEPEVEEESTYEPTEEVYVTEEPESTIVETDAFQEPTETEEETYYLSEEDINLIALVTMAEAEGEPEYGKRLVIDTILNRVDSGYFPNTVSGVVYQANQFTCMWNGRVNNCYVSEEICQLVKEELVSRSNYDVMFFCAGGYSAYGSPLFQVGNHYFSSYN